ncbi:hypothetical protein ACLBXM_17095 [Xanthobacteraceae bacterium A53D]
MTDLAGSANRSLGELDAALAAHRQALVLLFQVLARDEASRRHLYAAIEQRTAYRDAHEDPGAEADATMAFEVRVEEEVGRILADVKAALRVAAG